MRPPARPASSNSLRSPISPRSLSSASPTQTTLPTAPPSVRLSTFCIVLNRLDRTVHTGRWKYWSWCLVVPRLWRAWCTEPLLPRKLLMLTTAPQRLLCCSDKLIFGFSYDYRNCLSSAICYGVVRRVERIPLRDIPLSLSLHLEGSVVFVYTSSAV